MGVATNEHGVGSVLFVSALLMAATGCVTPIGPSASIDPAARAQIDRMRAAVGGLERYAMVVESVTDEMLPSGRLVQVGRTTEMRVERPDRMAVSVVRDSGERWSAWITGGNVVLLDETEARCARLALPAGLDEALQDLGDRHGLHVPLADIVSGLRRDDLLTRVESGLYVGTDTVADRQCHHLLFRQPVADWQVWIEAGEPALPRRILMTYKDVPDHPTYRATIAEWDIAPRFDDNTWLPRLPEGVQEVEMDELLSQE